MKVKKVGTIYLGRKGVLTDCAMLPKGKTKKLKNKVCEEKKTKAVCQSSCGCQSGCQRKFRASRSECTTATGTQCTYEFCGCDKVCEKLKMVKRAQNQASEAALDDRNDIKTRLKMVKRAQNQAS